MNITEIEVNADAPEIDVAKALREGFMQLVPFPTTQMVIPVYALSETVDQIRRHMPPGGLLDASLRMVAIEMNNEPARYQQGRGVIDRCTFFVGGMPFGLGTMAITICATTDETPVVVVGRVDAMKEAGLLAPTSTAS